MLLQAGLDGSTVIQLIAQLLGLGFAATMASGLVAVSYRWYVRERVPTGLAVLFGLTVISVYLGSTGSLGQAIDGQDIATEAGKVIPNLASFAIGAVGSAAGIRFGDAIGTDISAATGEKTMNADVSEIVQTVGRVTPVRLPDEIDDIVGYDPMPEKTKDTLEGRRFLFPRRLTKAELRDRLVSRLKTDYGVGHVDLELGDDGTVEYIAIGARAAGIGPTLPPSTNAVAIHADPAHAASSGDLVQVWSTEPFERVLTGELRGVTDDVVTIAIDAADTPKIDQTTRYKLVTLPVQDRPDREFASLLRAADETMGTITVGSGTELDGATVGQLGVTVVAITRDGGQPDPIPTPDRALSARDTIYAIAKPDALRRAETAASTVREPDPDETVATESSDANTVSEDSEPPAEELPNNGDTTDEDETSDTGDTVDKEKTPDDGIAKDDAESSDSESESSPADDTSDAETGKSAVDVDTSEPNTDTDTAETADDPTTETTGSEPESDEQTEPDIEEFVAEAETSGAPDSDADFDSGDGTVPESGDETEPDSETEVDTDSPDPEPDDGMDADSEEADPEPDDETDADIDDTVRIWDPEERLDGIDSDEERDRTTD
jgi:hypothetical protein